MTSDAHASGGAAAPIVGGVLAGKYRVTSVIGRGGMGVVYAGVHIDLDRPVAIKILRGGHDRAALQRFDREARIAGRISHPNVVTVHDFGRLRTGEPFLVMELLAGRDLEDLLSERRRLSPEEAAAVLVPVAAALDAMHAAGVVHRDVKPSNVFLGYDGSVKLVDFGLAVLAGAPERLTKLGHVVGTPEYLAPEAVCGEMIDARGDVYSLATIAFEMLTGVLPFRGDDPIDVLIAKTERRAPSISEVADVSFCPAVEHVIATALDREPSRRPASAGELVAALVSALRAPPTEKYDVVPELARPAEPRRTWWAPLRALLALAVGVAVWGAVAQGASVVAVETSPMSVPATVAVATSPPVDVRDRESDRVGLARSALLRGDAARARELFREEIAASPASPDAWRGLAIACEQLAETSEAAAAYRRYLELAPDHPEAAAVRDRLAALSAR